TLPLPPRATLFPYTTLFRSAKDGDGAAQADAAGAGGGRGQHHRRGRGDVIRPVVLAQPEHVEADLVGQLDRLQQVARPLFGADEDRKSTRLNSSHVKISYAV